MKGGPAPVVARGPDPARVGVNPVAGASVRDELRSDDSPVRPPNRSVAGSVDPLTVGSERGPEAFGLDLGPLDVDPNGDFLRGGGAREGCGQQEPNGKQQAAGSKCA